jgi:tetratricopeptide (TPR) repeat protein
MNSPLRTDSKLATLLACLTAILITAACYWPSLTGPFIFDDFPNLSPLGEFGVIDSWEKFLVYISSGKAGPLGRPLSLASFVLNSQSWPADPFHFRLTNLALHLANGILLFFLSRQIYMLAGLTQLASRMALISMTLWLLHPILVSTTAFIIQRMTQLSCFFSLLGLIGYLHGRSLLHSSPNKAWLIILSSFGLGGTLAVLSKESGALLPLIALSIEVTVGSKPTKLRAPQRQLLLLLLGLPSIVLALYIVALAGREGAYAYRDFTLYERLLTEARVIIDYLGRILMPRMSGSGLYHDDFQLSRSLTTPISTLLSVISLCVILATAILARKKYPLFALGALWFLAGHLLESTVLPLEIYYEHRNYLPLMGLTCTAAYLALSTPLNYRALAYGILALFITLEMFITWQNAIMWGDQRLLVQISAAEHPRSMRALERVALMYAHDGEHNKTLEYLERAAQLYPERNALKFSIAQTRCLLGKSAPDELTSTINRISTSKYEKEILQHLPEFISLAKSNKCPGINFSTLHHLLDAIEVQARLPGPGAPLQHIYYQRGMLFAAEGQHTQALAAMSQSYRIRPNIDTALLQAVWLISIRKYEQAEFYLDKASAINTSRSRWQISRDVDIDGYRSLIHRGQENPEFVPFQYPLKLKNP